MAISVDVPPDVKNVKTKAAFNLTARQLVCFGAAAAVGFPFYLGTKGTLGTQTSSLLMVAIVMPFFLLAMWEKDGFPAEKVLYFLIRQKILLPGVRPYREESTYAKLEKMRRLEKEARELENKAYGKPKGKKSERQPRKRA